MNIKSKFDNSIKWKINIRYQRSHSMGIGMIHLWKIRWTLKGFWFMVSSVQQTNIMSMMMVLQMQKAIQSTLFSYEWCNFLVCTNLNIVHKLIIKWIGFWKEYIAVFAFFSRVLIILFQFIYISGKSWATFSSQLLYSIQLSYTSQKTLNT